MWHAWFPVQHWIAVHLGIGTSRLAIFWYSFWSGIGSDLGEYTIAGSLVFGVVHTVREHNCGQRGCKRVGHLHEWEDKNGVKHKLCRHHHPHLGPDHRLTAELIAEHHAANLAN